MRKINLAPGGSLGAFNELSYYNVSDKVYPEDGKPFTMYAGLYYFFITKGRNTRFLRAKSQEDLEAKKNYDWVNVLGIEEKLAKVLLHNIKRSPYMHQLLGGTHVEAVWEDPLGKTPRNHEQRWVRIVNRTLHRLRCEEQENVRTRQSGKRFIR